MLEPVKAEPQHKPESKKENKLNSIFFLRRRALYARPALNAKGQVRFGFKHDRTSNTGDAGKLIKLTSEHTPSIAFHLPSHWHRLCI